MADPRVESTVRAVASALSRAASEHSVDVIVREAGTVRSVADAVLHVAGLPGAAIGELLSVDARSHALVLGLGPDGVEAIALDDTQAIRTGSAVRATGRTATIPAGAPLLGRVIDPLGRPLDGAPIVGPLHPMPLERRPPQIHERASVHTPLLTGILAVDAMLPIGRGQRELVLGEEGTGKTSLALDAILRQRTTEVVGVYVAVGRRRAETWQIVEALRQSGGRWVVVAAPEDTSPGLRYLAPFAGTAVGEYFMDRGEHALVVYDDLSAHAVAWRESSLLLRRSPGREAYPADVFYLHSRLLERAAQLSAERGGGSLTALPLAGLEGGRLTAYIPTNLISITDGQIVLSRALFTSGQRPAIDAALSVSRVGAKAQPQALSDLAKRLKLEYASFLELEVFARLGTRLEESTVRRLALGRRVRALLRAERLAPLSLFDEVARVLLATQPDLLLRVSEPEIGAFSQELCRIGRERLAHVADRVERDGVLSTEDRGAIVALAERVVEARAQAAERRTALAKPEAPEETEQNKSAPADAEEAA